LEGLHSSWIPKQCLGGNQSFNAVWISASPCWVKGIELGQTIASKTWVNNSTSVLNELNHVCKIALLRRNWARK